MAAVAVSKRAAVLWALLAAVVGMALLVAASHLYVADYTAGGGGRCGSLERMNETVHYSPPNDGGCASAKNVRVILFLATGIIGIAVLLGGTGGALWLGLRRRGDGDVIRT